MDRSAALAFADEVCVYAGSASERVNLFDPRVSPDERAKLVDHIRQILDGPYGEGGLRDYRGVDINRAVDVVFAERREVMASAAMCVKAPPPINYEATISVQHCRSELRLQVRLDLRTAIIHHVLANHRRFPAVCPSPPAGQECERVDRGLTDRIATQLETRYGALGIGTGLYRRAATEASALAGAPVRVDGTPGTSFGKAVRWKLHCQNPYLWGYPRCRTCEREKVAWSGASSVCDFPTHARHGADEPNYDGVPFSEPSEFETGV